MLLPYPLEIDIAAQSPARNNINADIDDHRACLDHVSRDESGLSDGDAQDISRSADFR
jgi:hypothetical protein